MSSQSIPFRLDFSLRIGTTGSQVPYRSLNQSHAAFMPAADWAVSRHRPTLSRSVQSPRFRHRFKFFTTRHQRFTRVRLFESHLPGLSPTFPATLTTRALYPRSLWWLLSRSEEHTS